MTHASTLGLRLGFAEHISPTSPAAALLNTVLSVAGRTLRRRVDAPDVLVAGHWHLLMRHVSFAVGRQATLRGIAAAPP